MRVIVAVPRRSDGGHRDRVWSWVRARWAVLHPTWEVHEGHHEDGPFNRSKAINAAADRPWDVMVIADSDSFVSAGQVSAAAEIAHTTGQVTFAYDRFAYLNHSMTKRILAGYDGNWWPGVQWTMAGTCSSMVVVPRRLWDEIGGADEGFVGWGGEDVALSLALQTFGGGMNRTPGEVWHLWHPPAPHTHDDSWPGRLKRYDAAAYDRAAMRALLDELRAPETFSWHGESLSLLDHPHNTTRDNERAVEVPIARHWIDSEPGGLEVGNVLGNYGPTAWDVVDAYEEAEGVVNSDMMDLNGEWPWVLAVSTVEHVGNWPGEPPDPGRAIAAAHHLVSLVSDGGRCLITVPFDQNPALDAQILDDALGADRSTTLVWSPDGWTEIDGAHWRPRRTPHIWPAAVWIGEWYR